MQTIFHQHNKADTLTLTVPMSFLDSRDTDGCITFQELTEFAFVLVLCFTLLRGLCLF